MGLVQASAPMSLTCYFIFSRSNFPVLASSHMTMYSLSCNFPGSFAPSSLVFASMMFHNPSGALLFQSAIRF